MTKGSFRPHVEYDKESDAIYVKLTADPISRSKCLDDRWNIDYSKDGTVVGIEFLGVAGILAGPGANLKREGADGSRQRAGGVPGGDASGQW